MSKLVTQITLGIDVSKDELVICDWDTEALTTLSNQGNPIKSWLKSLYGPVRIAIEPTSSYHLKVLEQAHALGLEVYLISPRPTGSLPRSGQCAQQDRSTGRLVAGPLLGP